MKSRANRTEKAIEKNLGLLSGEDTAGKRHFSFLRKINPPGVSIGIPELEREYTKIYSATVLDPKFKTLGVETVLDYNSYSGRLLYDVLEDFSQMQFHSRTHTLQKQLPTNIFHAELDGLGMCFWQPDPSHAKFSPIFFSTTFLAAINGCKTDGKIGAIISGAERLWGPRTSKNLADGIRHELGHFYHHSLVAASALDLLTKIRGVFANTRLIPGKPPVENLTPEKRENFARLCSGFWGKVTAEDLTVNKTGNLAFKNPDETINRNISEAFFFGSNGIFNDDVLVGGSSLWKKIRDQVSSYAISSPYEFVAEVFVKVINGTWAELDPRIMALYGQLHGPRPVTVTMPVEPHTSTANPRRTAREKDLPAYENKSEMKSKYMLSFPLAKV
jgi:hypothetical protein